MSNATIEQAVALQNWVQALDAWSMLPKHLQEVAKAKVFGYEPETKSQQFFGVYRKFSPSQGATADGSGSGSVSDSYNRKLVGVATDRKSASNIILNDAYNLSGTNVYSAAVSELNMYENGVDTFGFSLNASWDVEALEINLLLPEYRPRLNQIEPEVEPEVSSTA